VKLGMMDNGESDQLAPRPPHPIEGLVVRLLSPQRGEAWVQFRSEMYERKVRRASEVLDTAVDESGLSQDDFLERVRSDERRGDLMDTTLVTATETISQPKLRGLARVLAAGVMADSDTEVDASFVLRRILAEMDPPHIRALALMEERGSFNPHQGGFGNDALAQWLLMEFPGLGAVSNQVSAFLIGNGLVTDPFYVNGVLSITDLGRTMLALVRDAS
jgi:hypothetical protein